MKIEGKWAEKQIFSKRVVYKTALLLYDGYGKRFPENIFHNMFSERRVVSGMDE